MLLRFRTTRRRKLLEAHLDPAVRSAVERDAAFLKRLKASQRENVWALARVFAAEKTFEGAGDGSGAAMSVTEEMRLLVALQACWMLVGLGLDPVRDAVFPNVKSVIVYPGAYWNNLPMAGPSGVVTVGRVNLGEAHHGPGMMRGPVLLSWPEVAEGARNSNSVIDPRDAREQAMDGLPHLNLRAVREKGRNLVLHEFAHKLDMLDGVVDGTPPLPRSEGGEKCKSGDCWRDVMTRAYENLRRDASRGKATVLDAYGATNPAEFFAVSVEMYFMQPRALQMAEPELYELLARVFGWRA